jgi:stress-induced morphogen
VAGLPTNGGPIEVALQSNLMAAFSPTQLQVLNESHMHSGPATESHFKVVVVSEHFSGLNLLKRHRAVNGAAKEQLDAGLHALSIIALTPAQWEQRSGAVPASPLCGGGSKGG